MGHKFWTAGARDQNTSPSWEICCNQFPYPWEPQGVLVIFVTLWGTEKRKFCSHRLKKLSIKSHRARGNCVMLCLGMRNAERQWETRGNRKVVPSIYYAISAVFRIVRPSSERSPWTAFTRPMMSWKLAFIHRCCTGSFFAFCLLPQRTLTPSFSHFSPSLSVPIPPNHWPVVSAVGTSKGERPIARQWWMFTSVLGQYFPLQQHLLKEHIRIQLNGKAKSNPEG